MKTCSCKVFGYLSSKNKTQNVVLVEEDPGSCAVRNKAKINFFMRLLEPIYDKCAGYNLRWALVFFDKGCLRVILLHDILT